MACVPPLSFRCAGRPRTGSVFIIWSASFSVLLVPEEERTSTGMGSAGGGGEGGGGEGGGGDGGGGKGEGEA
eukprot:7379324-Prymnesium_polylepis.1